MVSVLFCQKERQPRICKPKLLRYYIKKWGVISMYFYSEEMFNVTYSVDMLRLKTYITYQEFSEIEFRFKTCWADFVKNQYTSGRFEHFFYNYNIEI